MTVFLPPDGRPFYGGTYFPPRDRQYGREPMPGFPRILLTIANYYEHHRAEVEEQAAQLANYLKQLGSAPLRHTRGINPSGTMPLQSLTHARPQLSSHV